MIFFCLILGSASGSCPPGFLLCIPLDGSQLAGIYADSSLFLSYSDFSSATEFCKVIGVRCGYMRHLKKL